MLTRKIISILLAVVFVATMAFTPALADDTPPVGGGTGDQHPWDINDGGVDPGNGTVNQAPSLTYVMFPGWYGNLMGTALMVASVTPTMRTADRVESPAPSAKSTKHVVRTRNLSR